MTAKANAKEVEYVTSQALDAKLESFGEALIKNVGELLKERVQAATSPSTTASQETPYDREVKKAGPDIPQVNPEWDEKAREILGDAVERTEFKYLKTGGVIFTVVVKEAHSNAPDAYLAAHKEDKRSKEIGQEGTAGVENWCKLIKANLTKGKPM